jgi:hypothetical protein
VLALDALEAQQQTAGEDGHHESQEHVVADRAGALRAGGATTLGAGAILLRNPHDMAVA